MKVVSYLFFNVYKVHNGVLYTSSCMRKGYKNFCVYFCVFAKTNT